MSSDRTNYDPMNGDIPLIVGKNVSRSKVDYRSAIDQHFTESVKLPRFSVVYGLLVVIVGFISVLLPLLYLLLPIALGYLGVMIFIGGAQSVRSINSAIIVYGSSIGLLSASMALLAPLFRRRHANKGKPISVTKESEPHFYHLVEACAKSMRAQLPKDIQFLCEANAAVVDNGKEVVLQIGLPLVACLSARELTGVIAHEMAHVRQGWARKFQLLVIKVFQWFEEVIIESGGNNSGNGGIFELARAISLFLGIFILSLFLRIASKIMFSVSRQMEIDADRVAAATVGKEPVRSALEVVCAADSIINDLCNEARKGSDKVPDNVPRYAAHFVNGMPPAARKRVSKLIMRDSTGVVHPSYDNRVRYIANVAGRNSTVLDFAAEDIFQHFDQYAKRATADMLVPLLGHGGRLQITEKLIESKVNVSSLAARNENGMRGLKR